MRRLERTQLEEMGRELELLRQQIDIERSVHATTVEFLSSKVGDLQSQAASWQSKRDEDGHTKDRELEVGWGVICWDWLYLVVFGSSDSMSA